MKLIVDIDEDVYTRLFDNGIQDNEIAEDDVCEMARALRLGTPLDDVKAEIKRWYWQADKQALAKDPCVVDAMVDLFIRTIDNIGKVESEDKK